MDFEKRGSALTFGIVHPLPLRHSYAVAFGEQPESFGKGEALDLLHKLENVARCVAAETLVILMPAVDAKRGCFFGVKRAQSDPALSGPLPFQAHVLADDLDDVQLVFKLLSKIHLTWRRKRIVSAGEGVSRLAAARMQWRGSRLA